MEWFVGVYFHANYVYSCAHTSPSFGVSLRFLDELTLSRLYLQRIV